jgi:4-hydroxybenzoate polyprenyltransferase
MDAAELLTGSNDRSVPGRGRLLVRACHPEPTAAVTTLAALLAVADKAGPARSLLIALAVLSGQLVIGWSNDLVDAGRDREVGRTDKPLATGRLDPAVVRGALIAASVACVVLSLLLGWQAGTVHLVLLVGSGLAYNLRLKATIWSWLPYAVAFGSLPAVVTLGGAEPHLPPAWMVVAGAMLGVGAHFVNTLPDLDDDARTSVRGLPHRLGARGSQLAAMVVLVAASVAAHVGPPGPAPWWSWLGLGVVLLLATLGLVTSGRTPFRLAILIAVIDVAVLVMRG